METVSVVIPTYNRSSLVCEAISSVLAQCGGSPEIIVVDDGSTDDTADALRGLDARIRYLRRSHLGVAAARNEGARAAGGRWLAFLDSDDLWSPQKLARQMALHAARPELLASQTGEIWLRNGTRVNPRRHHAKPDGDIFLPSLSRCLVSPSAVVLHRDLFFELGGFDETLPVCEDYDLWLRLGCVTHVALLAEPLVIKRGGHPDQLSRAMPAMDRYRVASLAKLLASQALPESYRRAAVEVLRQKCRILAHGARKRGRGDEADRYALLAEAYGCG
jgi:glycosyltransferase involved in cell wall biosynthesis